MEDKTPPLYQVWDYLKEIESDLDLRIEFWHVKNISGKDKSEELSLIKFKEEAKIYDLTRIKVSLQLLECKIHFFCRKDEFELLIRSTDDSLITYLVGIEISDVAEFMGIAKEINQIYSNYENEQ